MKITAPLLTVLCLTSLVGCTSSTHTPKATLFDMDLIADSHYETLAPSEVFIQAMLEENDSKRLALFNLAASKGHKPSMFELGLHEMAKENHAAAIKYINASLGEPVSPPTVSASQSIAAPSAPPTATLTPISYTSTPEYLGYDPASEEQDAIEPSSNPDRYRMSTYNNHGERNDTAKRADELYRQAMEFNANTQERSDLLHRAANLGSASANFELARQAYSLGDTAQMRKHIGSALEYGEERKNQTQ